MTKLSKKNGVKAKTAPVRAPSRGNVNIKDSRASTTRKTSHSKTAGRGGNAPINVSISPPDEVKVVLSELSSNEAAISYLNKNVSKRALQVVEQLSSPKTDEDLAAMLDMKINAVRRILNILQGHGVTNYYVSKNVNGWLSFAWYINVSKLKPFFNYVESIENKKPVIDSDCNDYFVCNACYDRTKLIFTFDAAFEGSFKCNECGDGLLMINRDTASKLAENLMQVPNQQKS
jgi:transcription initiation factor IIE alpha subunit